MLEHFATQTSPVEGECEALGSVLLLRLENGWAMRHSYGRDNAADLALNIEGMLRDCVNDDLELPKLIPSRKLDFYTEDSIVRGVATAFGNLDEILADTSLSEEEVAEYKSPTVQAAFVAWIRRGYRRAMKRFSECDGYTVGMVLFEKIAKAADSLIRSESLWEGARVRISAHLRRCEAVIKVFDPDTRRWVDAELYC
ncbi:hypothetical protein [Variovorax sp. PBL-H6]|uniref:hypothetical protein n=2 Tax=Variovorax TaxID=34072 RepID=UPI0013A54D81|nr:hypothetical protein [Variovorax sp. PBL-H6]